MGDHWWTLGENVSHMHNKALWEELDFTSFTKWLQTLPISRQTAYDAMDAWEKLHKLEGYRAIRRENAKTLARDVTESRRPRYLKAALTMGAREFKAFVEGGKVGAAKAEDTIQKHIIFTTGQWEVVKRVHDKMVEEQGDAPDLAHCIEYWAVEYENGLSETN